ncbi:MAG: radical SAM protein [Actinobacteria bacterium]|nr:radical SAM protein [Actinomycetota bacterium]
MTETLLKTHSKRLKVKYIIRKSLLYKSKVEYSDFCINHIEGCSHGCRFPCYAMLIKKRAGIIKDYEDWIRPKIVRNSLELLDKEIPKYKNKIKYVHLCFSTDPFMYNVPEIKRLSLKIIEKLNKQSIKCSVLTKGILPKTLINSNKYSSSNEYGITLISLNPYFKEKFEPFSAPYSMRIASLKYLHEKGFKTWASIEPYPTPNFIIQDLDEILDKISFVDKIVFGKMNYNPEALIKNSLNFSQFYKNCVNTVLAFCKQKNIEYHIKNGTG